jgi:hypothetical protein
MLDSTGLNSFFFFHFLAKLICSQEAVSNDLFVGFLLKVI